LRKCVSAGEHLPRHTFEQWKKLTGISIIDGIGSTEMLHIFISTEEQYIKPGSTGKPIPGYLAKIVDSQGNEMPPHAVGLLAVIGPTGCKYLNKEQKENSIQNGWYLTGDVFHKDDDGYFYFHSRADNIIISSGYNISPVEIENAILEFPGVEECAVIGVPDPIKGHLITAYIKLQNNSTKIDSSEVLCDSIAMEIKDYLKTKLAIYKCPHQVEFTYNIPRNLVGKIQKYKLR
jgi:2-aminobenzoate-CoA ligase